MPRIILPTDDIIKACSGSQRLLAFLDDGIRDVIQWSVHSQSRDWAKIKIEETHFTGLEVRSLVMQEVVERYCDSQYDFEEVTAAEQAYALSELSNVEHAVTEIESHVKSMMDQLFNTKPFFIDPHYVEWLDTSLIIHASTRIRP
jgi:hypothetical protein